MEIITLLGTTIVVEWIDVETVVIETSAPLTDDQDLEEAA